MTMTTASQTRQREPTDAPAKLTYEDYAKTPENERWELIDGVLIMAAAPNIMHQTVQRYLGTPISVFVDDNDTGKFFFSPTDVVLSDTITTQPDLIFVSNERARIITAANIQGAPDLVVEILSPSTSNLDWRDKMNLYEIHRIPEYWVVDPGERNSLGIRVARWQIRTPREV